VGRRRSWSCRGYHGPGRPCIYDNKTRMSLVRSWCNANQSLECRCIYSSSTSSSSSYSLCFTRAKSRPVLPVQTFVPLCAVADLGRPDMVSASSSSPELLPHSSNDGRLERPPQQTNQPAARYYIARYRNFLVFVHRHRRPGNFRTPATVGLEPCTIETASIDRSPHLPSSPPRRVSHESRATGLSPPPIITPQCHK
jgi:hypothetical protein